MAFVSYTIVFFSLLQGALCQQYRWECSPLDSGANRFYLPAFDEGNSFSVWLIRSTLVQSSPGTYIYPIDGTQVNCSGIITDVEYCYRATRNDIGVNRTVFTLSTLMHSGASFTVTGTSVVHSTPTNGRCSLDIGNTRYCCDVTSLDHFQLPSQNFAYGLTIPQGSVNLLGWGTSYPQYNVGQYRSSVVPTLGYVYMLSSAGLITNEAHRLLRFHISPIQSSSVLSLPLTTMSVNTLVERSIFSPVTPSVSASVVVSMPQTSSMVVTAVSVTLVTEQNSLVLPSDAIMTSPSIVVSMRATSSQEESMSSFISMTTAPIVEMSMRATSQEESMSSFISMTTAPILELSTQVNDIISSSTMTTTAPSIQSSIRVDSMISISTRTLTLIGGVSSTGQDNIILVSTTAIALPSTLNDALESSSQQFNVIFSSSLTTATTFAAMSDVASFSTPLDIMVPSSIKAIVSLTTISEAILSTQEDILLSSSTSSRTAPSSISSAILVSSTQSGSISVVSIMTTMAPLPTPVSSESTEISSVSDTSTPSPSTTILGTITTSSHQLSIGLFSSSTSSSVTTISPSSTVRGSTTSLIQDSSSQIAPLSSMPSFTPLSAIPSIASMTPISTMAVASETSSSQPNNIVSLSLEITTSIYNTPSSTVMPRITPTNTMDSETSQRGPGMTTPIEMVMDTTRQVLDAQPSSISYGLIGGVVGGVIALLVVVLAVIVTAAIIMKKSRLTKWNPSRERSSTGLAFSNAIYSGDDIGRTDSGEKLGKESNEYDYAKKSSEYDYAGTGPHVSDFPTAKRRLEDTLPCLPPEAGYESLDSKHPPEAKNQTFYDSLRRDGSSAQYNPANTEDRIYVAPATDVSGLYAQLDEIMMDTDIVTRDNIKLGKLLGSGQFGDVYRGTWEHTAGDIEVAVKTLKKGAVKTDRVKFLQEAAIMGQFRHPNVVTMHGVVTDGEPVLLVLEMLKKGDLRQYLISMRLDDDCERISPDLDGHVLLSFCRQIASGMAYLSNKAFVHRDLAARNVLVSGDGICKIADFGMSRDLADENYYISQGGKIPVKWTAPEALCYKKYSTSSDVWSYGTVMYEIWSVGHKPFEGIPNEKVLHMIESGYRLPPPPGCPRAVYAIMMSCWALKVSDRPPFSKLCIELSYPDSKLLYWADEDKAIHCDATKLGSNLRCTDHLYKDLQLKFFPDYAKGLSDGYEDKVVHL